MKNQIKRIARALTLTTLGLALILGVSSCSKPKSPLEILVDKIGLSSELFSFSEDGNKLVLEDIDIFNNLDKEDLEEQAKDLFNFLESIGVTEEDITGIAFAMALGTDYEKTFDKYKVSIEGRIISVEIV